jgi:hypothetical protein
MQSSCGAGKKFNLLRNRVEPAVYDVDQLLLGTILFTLVAFLFPTVLVYYLAFASVSRDFTRSWARPDFADKLPTSIDAIGYCFLTCEHGNISRVFEPFSTLRCHVAI